MASSARSNFVRGWRAHCVAVLALLSLSLAACGGRHEAPSAGPSAGKAAGQGASVSNKSEAAIAYEKRCDEELTAAKNEPMIIENAEF